ncbi:sulfurtransferase TusA family protein [Candidatus Kinetoplastidibacterium crithidiae]|uniref:SirA-like protein n=1 Tax=Candidatus Kinetoplastidibacterium crithidiae TCC036E TaxID=1208918 RepID=M1M6G6_9PROT|nr:sulfurtransferase TusA family protein [Candidatus Kinetoplastibacterium crithidii]AFZ82654.1 tRNA 2-thiouridine synthesizing protein A [Candidatus Kinetoplastibacterium crithidii (ex Angomonas deanei ATCC 30255)]AGF47685.1 SirA-like protein [Candidatus Kinetoplastibacterium crithidii TCC036E]
MNIEESKDIEFDSYIDARGLNCPLPILKTKKALSEMESGQILRIITTDVNADSDFNIFSKQTGNNIIMQRKCFIEALEVTEHFLQKR